VAGQSITFDFISRGGPALAADFKRTGDNAAAAARGAKVLQATIEQLGKKENRTAAESATLAKALRLTGDAEDRAAAKALAADIAIRRLDDALKDSSKSAAGARGGFGGLAGEITGFGAASTAASSKSSLLAKALAGINLASGVLEPALAGVVVAAGGAAAALASAGIGAGVFGAVAGGVFAKAKDAADKFTKAQDALNAATTSTQRQKALADQKAAFQGLNASQVQLAKGIGSAKNQWGKFLDAASPGVVKPAMAAMGLLPRVFQIMQPFLAPVEKSLTGIIGEIRKGIAPGSQFSKIMGDFAAHSGTSLKLVLETVGHLFMGLLGVVHAFLPAGQGVLVWAEKASEKFQKWGLTLNQHTGFKSLMTTFRTETPQALEILRNLGTVIANVGKAMFGLSTFSNSKMLLQALLPLSGILASLSKNTALTRIVLYLVAAGTAARKLGPAFTGVKAGIEGIGGALKFASANPIILVAAAIIGLGVAAYLAWKKFAPFRDVIKDIGVVLLEAGIIIVKANKIIIDSFLSMVGTVLHAAATAFGWVPGLGDKLRAASKHFDGFKAGVDGVMDGLIGKMQDWQGALNQSKQTVAGATASIVKNFHGQGAAALLGRDDVNAYTIAVQSQGAKSDAAKSARQRLITDLENSGLSAKAARKKVDELQGAIDRMHGKDVPVGVTGSGKGGVVITTSGIAAAGQGNVRFHAAMGGRVPFSAGIPGKDSVLVMTKPGEIFVPPEKGPMLAPALHAAGIPGFASGGFAGMDSALGSMAGVSAGVEGRGAAAAMAAGVKAAIAKEKASMAAMSAVGPSSGGGHVGWAPGAGVNQWRLTTLSALAQLGLPSGFVLDVLYQMMTESGGNPNIVNRWDSNWLAGHPSVGLMQVIAGTFAAYAGPYRNTGPFSYGVSVNPMANIYAALNYGKHGRGFGTGPGQIGSGHGYAAGTPSAAPGWAVVGERGPELVKFSGGEQVVPGVPGFATGGQVARQGAADLRAWRAHRQETVNLQIEHTAAAQHKAAVLASARLPKALHAHYVALAARDKKHLNALYSERTVMRDWRGNLAGSDATLHSWIAAAGNTRSLQPSVRAWKRQLAGQEHTIGEISLMLGLTTAQLKAYRAAIAAKAKAGKGKPPVPTGVQAVHTYGGDVTDTIGAFLAAAASPFTGTAVSMDRGGWLRPGLNSVWNGTGRPEPVGAARGSGTVRLEISSGGSSAFDQFMLTMIRKYVKVKGGTGPGAADRAFAAH
jgi:SLT domain-containing protein